MSRTVERIEQWPLERLKPYERNARVHSDAQIAQIAESIKRFGFNNPILVDGNAGIIAGHGRLAGARKLGLTAVPVIVLDHLSDAERRAYILADNKLAENAAWDDEMLAAELAALNEEEFDLGVIGFSDRELEKMLGSDDEPENDGPEPHFERLRELQAKWKTARGQVWLFGNGHRLLCGDATSPDDVARLMDGKKAQLCFTSPPYASQRNYMSPIDDWNALMLGMSCNLPMTQNGQVLVNLGLIHSEGEWSDYFWDWIEAMRRLGWRRFGWYVWHQGCGLPGDWSGRFAPSHEFVFHFNREVRRPEKILDCKCGGEKFTNRASHTFRHSDGTLRPMTLGADGIQERKIPDSVLSINRCSAHGTEHPATFPIGLSAFMLEAWTELGGFCYEPFAGSGTQFIAAERLERVCYGLEIAPEYCAVILERMTEAGMKPERIDG